MEKQQTHTLSELKSDLSEAGAEIAAILNRVANKYGVTPEINVDALMFVGGQRLVSVTVSVDVKP